MGGKPESHNDYFPAGRQKISSTSHFPAFITVGSFTVRQNYACAIDRPILTPEPGSVALWPLYYIARTPENAATIPNSHYVQGHSVRTPKWEETKDKFSFYGFKWLPLMYVLYRHRCKKSADVSHTKTLCKRCRHFLILHQDFLQRYLRRLTGL